MALDRQLTLSIVRRLPRPTAEPCVPVLMYHSISNEEEKGAPYYRLVTTPERFAEQMEWLHSAGYVGTSLEESLWSVDSCRCVAITFDDGYENFYTAAWPILQRYGFSATMYLPTGFIGVATKSLLGRQCLSWEQIRELHAQGVHFGSHSVTHSVLHYLSTSALDYELRCSRESIEDKLGISVTAFAYPYAFPQENRPFVKLLAERLRSSGYKTCATTAIGRFRSGDDLLSLKRLPVNSCDDRELFLAKLHGCYDWVGSAQYVVRHLKQLCI